MSTLQSPPRPSAALPERSRRSPRGDRRRVSSRPRSRLKPASTASPTPVSLSSALRTTTRCACISADVLAYRDEDGDWVCVKCGHLTLQPATVPMLVAPVQLTDIEPVA